MLELRLGKLTTKELADWFGISYGTFRNNKTKKFEDLKNYCEFDEVYGGIIIKEIYFSRYDKGYSKDDEVYLREVKASNEHISTISGIARKLKTEDKDYKDLSESQIKRRMTKAGVRTFGVTSNFIEKGRYGTREYVWAIKEDDFNKYRHLTKEEDEIFSKLILDFYTNKDNIDLIKKSFLLDLKFEEDDSLSKQEYLNINKQCGYDFYQIVIRNFYTSTGKHLVKGTYHELFGENKEEN